MKLPKKYPTNKRIDDETHVAAFDLGVDEAGLWVVFVGLLVGAGGSMVEVVLLSPVVPGITVSFPVALPLIL